MTSHIWTPLRTMTDAELLLHVANRDPLVQTDEERELFDRFDKYDNAEALLDELRARNIETKQCLEDELDRDTCDESERALLNILFAHGLKSEEDLETFIESANATTQE